MKPTLNLILPAGGLGSRFAAEPEKYPDPKPVIPVGGKPMISWVLSNFKDIEKETNLILIVQKSHNQKYDFKKIIESSFSFAKVNIVEIDGLTDGALRTLMRGAPYFIDGPIISANSDQFLEDFSVIDFLNNAYEKDGSIVTFKDSDPKWSFADVDKNGDVLRVAEKVVISDNATTGIYFFKYPKDFLKFAKNMFFYNVRHNGEFYVCPLFNEYIRSGKKINIFEINKEQMWGLGIPQDLQKFQREYLKENV